MKSWIENAIKNVPHLSTRARNVLNKSGLTRRAFLSMDRNEIRRLRNCGERTQQELVQLQRYLRSGRIDRYSEVATSMTAPNPALVDQEDTPFQSSDWVGAVIAQFPQLSVRAGNVLRKAGMTLECFLSMDRLEVLGLKNCGVKTAGELEELQRALSSAGWFERGLSSTDQHGAVELPNVLTTRAKRYAQEHRLPTRDPLSWDLNAPLRELGKRSGTLFALAEYKVQWYLQTRGGQRRGKSALRETFSVFRDLPFAARLCNVTIEEAYGALGRLIETVEAVSTGNAPAVDQEADSLLPAQSRNRQIAIRRFLPWGETLEELAARHSLTRERVRQIENKARKRLVERLSVAYPWLPGIQRVAQQTVKSGRRLSKQSLYDLASRRTEDPDAVIAVLAAAWSTDSPLELPRGLRRAGELIFMLPDSRSVTIRASRQAAEVSPQALRHLRRQAGYAGAFHISQACERLGLDPAATAEVLPVLGFKRINDEWFGPPLSQAGAKTAISNAASKVLAVAGPVAFSEVYEGIANHARRKSIVVAPASVVRHLLEEAGFRFDADDRVTEAPDRAVTLSGAESAYVSAIRRHGGCAGFWELYEELVLAAGFSPATLSTFVLRTSPVAKRLETGNRLSLYAVRGLEPTPAQVRHALARQPTASRETVHEFTLDGIRVETGVSTWLLTAGVIALPPSLQLPSGQWSAEANGCSIGAYVSDTFIYGLTQAVRALRLSPGDRIALVFSTASKRLTLNLAEESPSEQQ